MSIAGVVHFIAEFWFGIMVVVAMSALAVALAYASWITSFPTERQRPHRRPAADEPKLEGIDLGVPFPH